MDGDSVRGGGREREIESRGKLAIGRESVEVASGTLLNRTICNGSHCVLCPVFFCWVQTCRTLQASRLVLNVGLQAVYMLDGPTD